MTEEQQLIQEWEHWCQWQGLECMSADEMLLADELTSYQYRYIQAFIERWNYCMQDQAEQEVYE